MTADRVMTELGPLGVIYRVGEWAYCVDDQESDDDCRKWSHYAVRRSPQGEVETVYMDFTPYGWMTHSSFAAMIRLGFPKRDDAGKLSPLHNEDIAALDRSAAEGAPC